MGEQCRREFSSAFPFRNLDFEKLIKQATVDLKLQPEDSFILKVVQLQELFEVRHSVFIVGNAGTGKSQIWKVLNRTYHNQKRKPVAIDLNPKAVTNDELFGIINPATREWKDGLFSTIMRDLANVSSDGKSTVEWSHRRRSRLSIRSKMDRARR